MQHDEVVAQIRAAFAKTKARAIAAPGPARRNRARPPRAKSSRRRRSSWAISTMPGISPTLRHPDMPVLDILAALLGNGRSSRLYQASPRAKGLVHSVDAWTYSPGDPGLFGISADSRRGQVRRRARDAMLAEVETIRRRPCRAGRTEQSREAVHLGHAGHAQDHAGPSAGPGRQAGWRPTT